MNNKKLQRNIMRRVYYTYALRLSTHIATVHTLLLAVTVYALGYFVHVAAVMETAARVPLGELGSYALRVLSHADVMTLLIFAAVIMSALSLPFSYPKFGRFPRLQVA